MSVRGFFWTATLAAILSVVVSGLGHGTLGLLLAVVAGIFGLGAYLSDRASERRDARRRNPRR